MSLGDALLEDFETSQWESMGCQNNDLEKIDEIDENGQMGIDKEYSLDNPVRHIATLVDCERLKNIIEEIKSYSTIGLKSTTFISIENNPEYELIVKSNDIITDIDHELNIIHKYTKDIYALRFLDLATVVSEPVQYFMSIKLIKNNVKDVSKMKKDDFHFLDSATFLVLGVSASTTIGDNLPKNRLDNVIDSCDVGLELIKKKEFILKFVESRMPFFAPNLCALLGASVAAKLIGYKGGLRKLAETDNSVILNIGAPRKSEAHVGINSNIHKGCGYIYWIEAVQKLPWDLRKKAAKQFSNKAVIAARIDLGPQYRNGEKGNDLLMQVEKTIDKWMEPPPVKILKALPAPIDLPSKRRGGRRYRKRKERLGMTEVRKSANRMEFGGILEESYDNEMSVNSGSLGRTNKIRAAQADPKTKARVSKTLNQKLQKQQALGGSSMNWGGMSTIKKQITGTSTTVAFTPAHGLEISNPQLLEAKQEVCSKYFSTGTQWKKP